MTKCILMDKSNAGEGLELLSIQVTTRPRKYSYLHGEDITLSGMQVTASYGINGKVISSYVVYGWSRDFSDKYANILAYNNPNDTSDHYARRCNLPIKYTENGITKSTTVEIIVYNTIKSASLDFSNSALAEGSKIETFLFDEKANTYDISNVRITENYADGSSKSFTFAQFAARQVSDGFQNNKIVLKEPCNEHTYTLSEITNADRTATKFYLKGWSDDYDKVNHSKAPYTFTRETYIRRDSNNNVIDVGAYKDDSNTGEINNAKVYTAYTITGEFPTLDVWITRLPVYINAPSVEYNGAAHNFTYQTSEKWVYTDRNNNIISVDSTEATKWEDVIFYASSNQESATEPGTYKWKEWHIHYDYQNDYNFDSASSYTSEDQKTLDLMYIIDKITPTKYLKWTALNPTAYTTDATLVATISYNSYNGANVEWSDLKNYTTFHSTNSNFTVSASDDGTKIYCKASSSLTSLTTTQITMTINNHPYLKNMIIGSGSTFTYEPFKFTWSSSTTLNDVYNLCNDCKEYGLDLKNYVKVGNTVNADITTLKSATGASSDVTRNMTFRVIGINQDADYSITFGCAKSFSKASEDEGQVFYPASSNSVKSYIDTSVGAYYNVVKNLQCDSNNILLPVNKVYRNFNSSSVLNSSSETFFVFSDYEIAEGSTITESTLKADGSYSKAYAYFTNNNSRLLYSYDNSSKGSSYVLRTIVTGFSNSTFEIINGAGNIVNMAAKAGKCGLAFGFVIGAK